MRRKYPYLEDTANLYLITNSATETIQERMEKTKFLKQIDDFINQKQYVRITLLNWQEEPLKEIQGELTSGSLTKDGKSSVRRTCSLSASLENGEYNLDDMKMNWGINRKIYLEIGVKNETNEYAEYPILWFPQGVFFIASCGISTGADSSINISLGLKDKMCMLNGDIGGKFPATIQLDEVDTQDETGKTVTEKLSIYQLIWELVNHWGNESLDNILIEDVDEQIKRVMKWTGENPVYIKPSTSNESTYIYTQEEYEFIGSPSGFTEYGSQEDIGYIYDTFYYPEELTLNAGDNVCTALDKIVSTLGNYEYFYDIFGVFHFREIRNYLNTTQGSLVLEDMNENDYIIETTTGKVEYTFDDETNLISLSVNPQYDNIKNDYVVLGLKQMTNSDVSSTIMYHVAIDSKPATGNAYVDMILYKDYTVDGGSDDSDTVAGFPIWMTSKDVFPRPGNFNLIYAYKDINGINSYWYWNNDDYYSINLVAEFSETTPYISVDWRTDIYLQGLLASNTGTDANRYYQSQTLYDGNYYVFDNYKLCVINNNIYYEELKSYWPRVYDLENQRFYGEVAEGETTTYNAKLYDGVYYLDIIDENKSPLGEFSINAIGRRSDIVSDDDINCLFEPLIPDIIYYNADELSETELQEARKQCIDMGQTYCIIKNNIYDNLVTGGWRNPAYEKVKYEMYLHTNYQKSVSLSTLPVFYLEPNTLVAINDASTNTFGNYCINTITIPLGAGSTMALSGNEVFSRW